MLATVYCHLRKCSTNLARIYGGPAYATLTSSNMATASAGVDDSKLVEKIEKNVVQNVKTKEVRP